MRNMWKGFVLGAVTGAGIGLVADLAQSATTAETTPGPGLADRARRMLRGRGRNNMWKGLVLGAVTGAGIGVVADLAESATTGLAAAADQAGQTIREHGLEAGSAVASAAEHGAEEINRADLLGRANDLAHTLADSETAGRLRHAAHTTAEAIHQTTHAVTETAQDTAHQATTASSQHAQALRRKAIG